MAAMTAPLPPGLGARGAAPLPPGLRRRHTEAEAFAGPRAVSFAAATPDSHLVVGGRSRSAALTLAPASPLDGDTKSAQDVLDLLDAAQKPPANDEPEPEPEPQPHQVASAPLPAALAGKLADGTPRKASALSALSLLQPNLSPASPPSPTGSEDARSIYSAKIKSRELSGRGLCGSRGTRRLSAHSDLVLQGRSEAAQHIAKGDFMHYHKSGGKRKPEKRFFWFDHETDFIHWAKNDSRRYPDYKYKFGSVTAVMAGVAETVAKREKYTEEDHSLRIETVGHSTLHLRADSSESAKFWVHGLAETLQGALRESALRSSLHTHDSPDPTQIWGDTTDQSSSPQGSDRSSSPPSSPPPDLSDSDLARMDSRTLGQFDFSKSREVVAPLTEEELRMTRQALEHLANRNVDGVTNEHEVRATVAISKIMSLGPEAEKELLASWVHRQYEYGEKIIAQGDRGDSFFLLITGKCAVVVEDMEADTEKVVRRFEAPNAFGENALLTNQRRNATIAADSNYVKCLSLDRKTFIRLTARREVPLFWHRSSLKTKWSSLHLSHLGKTGTVALVDSAANEISVKFPDNHRVIFPAGALGLAIETTFDDDDNDDDDDDKVARAQEDPLEPPLVSSSRRFPVDRPTNSDSRILGLVEDWILRDSTALEGRDVSVLQCEESARYYFKNQQDEAAHIDERALSVAFGMFSVVYVLTLYKFYFMAVLAGLIITLNSISSTRSFHQKIKTLFLMRLNGRAVEPKTEVERPQYLNQLVQHAWIEWGVERMICKLIVDQANIKLEDVATWYPEVKSIAIESMTLGEMAPEILGISFENSDVFGEFRLNVEARLKGLNDKTKLSVKVKVNKKLNSSAEIPVSISDVLINADIQILCRFGPDFGGLTLFGLKLNKSLGLDYVIDSTAIHIAKTFAHIFGGIALQKVIQETVNESLWWMTHPCMFTMPWVDGAGTDLEASNPGVCVGQLEIVVKHVKSLPLSDLVKIEPDPYVKFRVDKSWPLREFKTHVVSSTCNPQFEHETWTQVGWNEAKCGQLVFVVYDRQTARADEALGLVEVPISLAVKAQQAKGSKRWEEWVKLRSYSSDDVGPDDDDAPRICLSLRFHPCQTQQKIPMLLSGEQSAWSVKSGVLKLEVVSCRHLLHGFRPTYIKIEYGRNLAQSANSGIVLQDKYESHHREEHRPTADERRRNRDRAYEYEQRAQRVIWRDQPVGFKAELELSVEDCRNSIRISVMSETPLKFEPDVCMGYVSAATIPQLLQQLGQWKESGEYDFNNTHDSGDSSLGGDGGTDRTISLAAQDTNGVVSNGRTLEAWLDLKEPKVHEYQGAAFGDNVVESFMSDVTLGVYSSMKKHTSRLGAKIMGEHHSERSSLATLGEDEMDDLEEDEGTGDFHREPRSSTIDSQAAAEWLRNDGASTRSPHLRRETEYADQNEHIRPQILVVSSFYACKLYTSAPSMEARARARALTRDVLHGSDFWGGPPTSGTLMVEVVGCEDLISADDNGLSDPYVTLSLGFNTKGSKGRVKGEKSGYGSGRQDKKGRTSTLRKTTVKKKTLNPYFGEKFLFPGIDENTTAAEMALTCTVYDQDIGVSDDFIGTVSIDLVALFKDQWIDTKIDQRFPLEDPEDRIPEECFYRRLQTTSHENEQFRRKCPLGQLHLRLGFVPNTGKKLVRGMSIMNESMLHADDRDSTLRSGTSYRNAMMFDSADFEQ